VLDPATLGVVSDAYAALGDSVKAAEYVSVMEVAVGQQPGTYHRAWSLFLLDHGRRVPEVLAAAQAEIADRRDIHGYDLLAWALFKAGRPQQARAAAASALALGTQDPTFLYHAGMIELAAGDATAGREHLEHALAIAPTFDPTAPALARAALDSLRRAGGDRR
jgi:Flp pilus assembly protein TadD